VKYSNDVKNVKCKHRFNAFFISGPFAPAYIIFGRGFAYKKLDNFRLSISPAAVRYSLVDNNTPPFNGCV
jgi:hypothetical protein